MQPTPATRHRVRDALVVGALLSVLAPACSRAPEAPILDQIEVLRLQDGDVYLYRHGSVYTYRRNNWFFYACADAQRRQLRGERPADTHRILIHIDSHSDAHRAPVCSTPADVRAARLTALEVYTAQLSITAYVLPMLYYGFADEVYWVQPSISCFQGPEEVVSFALEDREGWIQPAIRQGATPAAVESLTTRAFRGEPVARSQELAVAFGYQAEDWQPGSLTLHCLSLDQLARHVHAGRLANHQVLVDLDLDYFGTAGPPRGYGYLHLSPHGHVALGLLGGTLPVFYMTPDRLKEEVERLCELLDRLSPRVSGISESPDHAHRETLPMLVRLLQKQLTGARQPPLPKVHVRLAGPRETALSTTCAEYADVGTAAPPRLQIDWVRPPGDSLDVALYFDPAGSRDRLMARWRVAGDQRHVCLPLRVPSAGIESLLGPGWDMEIRERRGGALLFAAAFTLDADGGLMRKTLDEIAPENASISRDPAHYLALSPPEIIAEGCAAGLAPAETNRILLAHPHTLQSHCRNLLGFRRAGGAISAPPR
jgi:hypothetical protein